MRNLSDFCSKDTDAWLSSAVRRERYGSVQLLNREPQLFAQEKECFCAGKTAFAIESCTR